MELAVPSNRGADTLEPPPEPTLYRSAMVETSLTGGSSSASAKRLAAVLSREAKVRASEPFLIGTGTTMAYRRGLHRSPGAEKVVFGTAVHDPFVIHPKPTKGAFHAQSSSHAGARSNRNSLTTPHFSSSSARFSVPMNTSLSDTSTRATIVRLRSAGSVTEA